MREYNYDILEVIKKRWSPRAFSPEAINEEDLKAVLEAARYAPSCFNEQPWRYMVARGESLPVLQNLLMEKNFLWAKNAPVLILVLSKNTFDHNGKPNKYNQFDTGTSWGFLALEAVKRGLQTHAMAGFKKKLARTELNIPEEMDIIAMVALGKPGNLDDLDQSFHSGEKPNTRKSLENMILDVDTWRKE